LQRDCARSSFLAGIADSVHGVAVALFSDMAGWKDFREIVAWQRAESVKLRVYAFLERPKVKRDFRYCEQLREAARSAPANIAEGFGRFGNKEFARFVRIAAVQRPK
jgi:hypothetical protein